MPLVITEEQQMIKDSAKDLLKSKSPIAELRRLRDTKDELGYNPQLWSMMTELGLTSLIIPEQFGGTAFGYVGLGQVIEETGRTLTCSPLISTSLLAASAILNGGNETQQQTYLPSIADGSQLIALAVDEKSSHQPDYISTSLSDSQLSGKKKFVLDGHIADKFIMSAKENGESKMVVVDSKAKGITIKRVQMMDNRNAAEVTFENVNIECSLDSYDGDLLEKVLDIGRIGIAAEMLGSMQEAFERTVAYLKERKQFGVAIGSFQALQHRAAIMFGEIELCKSVVIKALQAIDNGEDLKKLASLSKAKCGEVFKLVSNEGIQMFGGIGMTDDEEIGFFLKRARVAQHTFGDTNFHLNRLASIGGY